MERGRPNRQRFEAAMASWICCDGGLGEASVRERVRERENRVRELKKRVGSENNSNNNR